MTYKPYEESGELKKAQAALQQHLSQKPQDYRSAWESALKQAVDSILNREDFRYDAASDPLYQNYRQQYIRDGRLAMLDTLGQATAHTGGYGNSYAQSAAQQAYAARMQQLNDRIPELYSLALDQYGLEGQAMADRLRLLQQQEDRDYSRWQENFDGWQSQSDLLANLYTSQSRQDYDRYQSDRDYQLKRDQAEQEQQRWQAEFDEAKRQYEQAQAAKATTSSKGGGGTYAGNQGIDAATVRKAQQFVGTPADGMWGKNSRDAAKAKGYDSLQAVIAAMGGGEKKESYEVDGMTAVRNLAQAGTDEARLNAYIASLTAQGKLTTAQAEQLRRQYISPKHHY